MFLKKKEKKEHFGLEWFLSVHGILILMSVLADAMHARPIIIGKKESGKRQHIEEKTVHVCTYVPFYQLAQQLGSQSEPELLLTI